jgi:hypothetical protein
MTRLTFSVACSVIVATIGAGGCAPATKTLSLEPGRTPVASRLVDLHLKQGTPSVVRLVGGETIQGKVQEVLPDRLELVVDTWQGTSTARSIAESDIQTIAKLPRVSARARTWIGAAIGAAATLPFSISMFGDMIVPGAIAGALFGSRPGDTRAEVIFERQASTGNGVMPSPTAATSRASPAAAAAPTGRAAS